MSAEPDSVIGDDDRVVGMQKNILKAINSDDDAQESIERELSCKSAKTYSEAKQLSC